MTTNVNVDLGYVVVRDGEFEDGTLVTPGETTFQPGLILARDSVSGDFVPFVVGGDTNENGIPKAVLGSEIVRAPSGSGNEPCRVVIGGSVNVERIFTAAADPITDVIRDALRLYSIVALDVKELNILDNQ